MNKSDINKIVKLALAEDLGKKDLTASLISKNTTIEAKIVSQQKMVFCGVSLVNAVYAKLDHKIKIKWHIKDGNLIKPKQILCTIKGPARAVLSGERTALNFLQLLSSTATLTNQFVKKLKGTKTKLLDTRKTIPGMRVAQKYAVKCGGGSNHRFGLYDALLIKENHVAACGSITQAIEQAQKLYPKKSIEIEVRNLKEFKEALVAKSDIIMLDNFSLKNIAKAVQINRGQAKLEISGGVNLNNINSFAKTGVDYISVGAITKTVVPIELSMLFC